MIIAPYLNRLFMSRINPKYRKLQYLISCIIGVLFASLMTYIGWRHNSMCEIHCESNIDWEYFLSIFGSWFISTALIAFLILKLLSILRASK